MGLFSKKRYNKKKETIRQDLSQHIFSVTAAEERSPSHRKLWKGATLEEAEEFVEYRMELRRKWIEKFFEFRPEVDPKIRQELTLEAYEDAEILKSNIMRVYDSQ